jgi:hypothetical protein
LAAKGTPQEQEVERYLADHYGQPGNEAPWFLSVTSVEISGPSLIVHTELRDQQTDRALATQICNAVSGYVFSANNHVGVSSLFVKGVGDFLLEIKQSADERCM